MGTILMVLQFLPVAIQAGSALVDVVMKVEGLVRGAGQGKVKKELALATLSASFDVLAQLQPGLDIGDNKARYLNALDKAIDGIVAVLNSAGVFSKSVDLDTSPIDTP